MPILFEELWIAGSHLLQHSAVSPPLMNDPKTIQQPIGNKVSRPVPNPAHTKKYDLRGLKNTGAPQNGSSSGLTPAMIKILTAVSAGMLVLILLALVFLLGPFLLQQGEMKKGEEIWKEMVRQANRGRVELLKDRPREVLLRNYRNRVIELGQELTVIKDNMSESQKEKFKEWILDEGMEYAGEMGFYQGMRIEMGKDGQPSYQLPPDLLKIFNENF